MKRLLFAALAIFFAQASIFGQLSLRPQVGINFASLSDDVLDSEWKGNVGYQFGVDLQIGGTFYVQPGLNYQSTSLTFEDVEDIDITTNRLNIPVLVGFRFFEKEDASFGARVFAGPNLALHLGEDFDDAISGLSTDDFNDAFFSFVAGAGLDISIIFVDVAYKFGISDFIDDEAIMEDVSKNIFFVNAGVRLGF